MIELNHVSKHFGSKQAVKDLSLTIPDGFITGFIGPNGAGKTTTINMIAGILKPDGEGTITLNGISMNHNPLHAKKQFVLVPDTPDIFLRLTGREYIRFMAQIYEVDPKEANERLKDLSAEFGMISDLDAQIQTYSHGMRQKTVVMAALVCNPPIWILDEPLTGLDPASSFLLKEKMRQHAQKGNCVLFSTHVLEVAEKLCDKIMLIQNGSLKYDGTIEELQEMYPDKTLEEIFLEVTGYA